MVGSAAAQVPAAESGSAPAQAQDSDFDRRLEALESAADRPGLGLGARSRYGDVSATFQIFGDVGADYRTPDIKDDANTVFSQGSATFFLNAQLGEDFRILSETALVEDRSASQERLWGMWRASDEFYAKFGTEHSNISRWNQQNHHGGWLETTVARPYLAHFEGDGGFLALHRTGLELGGTLSASVGRVEYFGSLSNGRGPVPTDKQRANDVDDSKQLELGLACMPECVPGLRFGCAVQFDDIPEDPASADPLRSAPITETVSTAHVEYQLERLEILGEFAYVDHVARQNNRGFSHHSAYLQLAYSMGDWTPYARIDSRDMRRGDPFYSPLDRDLDAWQQILGVRYEIAQNACVKLEAGLGQEEFRDGTGQVSEKDVFQIAAQVAWWL